MFKAIRFISRIVVGLTFVFSGFVKAVDPVGGAIKFSDYFQAFHMEWLNSLTLPMAIALAALEFTLGLLLIFNTFPKTASLSAFIFMIFFTVLALVLALFNPVSDCGCFGDALILTNWQTFWKNIFILAFATVLVINLRKTGSPFNYYSQLLFTFAILLNITFIAIYSLRHLPPIDFRPYAIGQHLLSGMSIPEGAAEPEYETTFILEKDGVQKEFTVDNYPYEDSTWVFVESKTKTITEGFHPPIHDFVLLHPQYGDITEKLLKQEGPLFLLVSPDITQISNSTALSIAELSARATELGFPFYCLTASLPEETNDFDRTNKTNLSYLQGDETNLKTIIRSNPGLVLLSQGTVAGKWHFRDFPTPEQIKHPLSTALLQSQSQKTILLIGGQLFLCLLLSMILFKSSKTINKNQ